ncbi:MAG: hypothetical protein EHM61_17155 [Acidobacteria bacterium]|nr:MAG: hypothetical protein EHM61_17155 [Acidobacteriota bacterium]
MTDDRLDKDGSGSAPYGSDPELTSALRQWKAPGVSDALDARILDSYRRRVSREPLWRRFFTTSVRVPLPVAVAVMALLVIALTLVVNRPAAGVIAPGQYVQATADQPVVARTSLAGFQAVEEVNVSVVKEQRQ